MYYGIISKALSTLPVQYKQRKMNYQQLTLRELKAIATSKNIIPTGDKRLKQTWVNALIEAETVSVSNARVDSTRTVLFEEVDKSQNPLNSITRIPAIRSQQCFDAHNFKLPTLESFNWKVAEARKIPKTWQSVELLESQNTEYIKRSGSLSKRIAEKLKVKNLQYL